MTEEFERFKLKRGSIRRSTNDLLTRIEEEMNKDAPDCDELGVMLSVLSKKELRLKDLDKGIEDKTPLNELEAEIACTEEYWDRILICEERAVMLIQKARDACEHQTPPMGGQLHKMGDKLLSPKADSPKHNEKWRMCKDVGDNPGLGMSENQEGSEDVIFKSGTASLSIEENEESRLADICITDRSLEEFSDIESLGWGGFGSVYKVKHKVDGKWYAVKIAKYKGDREKREVVTLAKLDHPNIVRYYTSWIGPHYQHDKSNSKGTSESQEGSEKFDSGRASFFIDSHADKKEESEEVESGLADKSITSSSTACIMSLYIKMELCTGGSLNVWFEGGGAERTREEATKVFQQIVQGVEYIHSQNPKMIHRDLKPDNILFGQDNIVKIGDFGLATVTCDESGNPIERTRGGGTETYMSPEQDKQKKYDEKTDIFPLGLIFFELLWKMKTGAERAEIWPKLRKGKFPDGFKEKFKSESSIIKLMLSVKPKDRPSASTIMMLLDSPQQTQGLQKDKNRTT